MGKRTVEKDRKARVAEMRRAEQAAERRRTLLVMGAALVVVAVLVGLVVTTVVRYTRDNSLDALGVPAADADCGEVTTEPAEGNNEHVDTPVDYTSVPPMFGAHRPAPEFPASSFYTADDRPELETLVHNLEHGYTILWYAEDLPQEQVDAVQRIADLARDEGAAGGKFIASAWDPARGDLPADTPVALTHWGATDGAKQYCGAVSGEAVKTFVDAHPASDSPEPNAQ